MPRRTVHTEYIAKIVIEIAPPDGLGFPEASMNPWWSSGATFSYKDTRFLVHRYADREPPVYFLFLDEVMDQQQTIEYLVDLCKASDHLPDGGVVFIDQTTNELVETNWDIGETEEWAEILERLLIMDSVLHTFSATDAAIEFHSTPEEVLLQNLNWEAMPDRLESSRQTEPYHVFKDRDKFIAQIQSCLTQLTALLTKAQALPEDYRTTILDYLSVNHRRGIRR